MEGLVFIIVIGTIIHFVRIEKYKDSIASRIDSFGGRLISYERCGLFTSIGPFKFVGKGKTVYKIEYEVDGIKKVGWVRFGGIFGPDWKM
ncbi:hypothetical protein IZY60_13255 [Lutibacter sp. B2]|nr:hypothetical protein [Lutibacter sp. B2]